MKTIGIIGGLSPESTMTYYRWLNDGVRERLGGNHNARTIISSVDFQEFKDLKDKGDWETQGVLLAAQAANLQRAGADFILLSTNTMHKVAGQIEAAIDVPFLHLADTTAARIGEAGLSKIALLGTIHTMAEDFYKERLKAHGIEALVPDEESQNVVSDIIYDELCKGVVSDQSRERYKEIIAELEQQGAQGVILGCTEITKLIGPEDVNIPVFDTTKIHVEEALKSAFT
ncbi:MAG: aspartate racemase [Micavibrio sp.]|nr:MAG: aspartate racemase [Micavibrio sp.]